MNLPAIGSTEKTATSRYQVTLVDKTDTMAHPMSYPRTHRFFDDIASRNRFVMEFESAIHQTGGRLVQNPLSHPLFVSFELVDKHGHKSFEITVYH